MSMMGNIAIEGELTSLLKYMETIKDKPAEEQLALIEKWIRDDLAAAKGGWL